MQDIFARLATSRHSKYISLQDLSRKVNNIFMYYNIFIEDSSNNAKKRKSCQDNKILVTDVITNNFQNENLSTTFGQNLPEYRKRMRKQFAMF